MVVCKFFLQGSCRYGSSCKFEHSYNTKYSYHAPKNNAPQQQVQPQPQASVVTDEQLLNQVRADVQIALKGNQWILSCYAPFKEKPGLPGITDLSPEEARLFFYEAKAANNLDQAVAYMNNLYKDARQKHEQLLQPNAAMMNTLRSLYKGERVPSPFQQSSGFGSTNNAANSVFKSAVQSASVFGQSASPNASSIFAQAAQNAPSIFGSANQKASSAASIFGQANQTNSVFGQPSNSNTAASIFGQANQNSQAASIFGQANQAASVFGQAQNTFSSSPGPAQSVFAQASQSAFGSPFGVQTSEAPKSIFAQANQNIPQTQNVFQINQQPNSGNVLSNASPFSKPSDPFAQQFPSDVYSRMEELTDVDLEAFKSVDFKLGFIPELPPPQELCV